MLFVRQTFVDTDTRCPAGRHPTGNDRKHDDDPKPNPNAVSGRVVFCGEIDHLSQCRDKRRSRAEPDGQGKDPTGETQHQTLTGKNKTHDTGKVTCANLQLYGYNEPASISSLAYVKNNPAFLFRDISTQCNVARIASQDNMVAINNILGVDLLGQIVITHLGTTPITGPGGQVDFCIGAHYSKGGRSISMLKSTALDGKASRIVPKFEAGTVIMIPMVYLDYLVTEFGVANLDCKSRRERAEAIISVAHPDFRDELRRAAKEMFYP